MRQTLECKVCGKPVIITPSRVKGRDSVCCSYKCNGKYKKSLNPNYIPCEVCGKLTYKKPNEQNKQKNICCSFGCLGELRKTIYLNENNPNYGNRASNNPMTKNEIITNYGYRLIHAEGHPHAINGFWIKEHRLLAEKYLMEDFQSIEIDGNKYLSRKFDVHHINGDRLDNRLENLKIMSRSDHMRLHLTERWSRK